jgi:D-glycero-alpha-D-manno-heptose 1-phosphate guanylyltransferase
MNGSGQACVILAGGLGTRLRSVTGQLPKCLAPVGQRPFLDLQIERLRAAGIGDIILSLGHGADKVLRAINDGPNAGRIRHVIEAAPLGTGGAIAHAMDTLGLDEALVTNGDTDLGGDIGGMLLPLKRAQHELFRMAVVEVPERRRFGGVKLGVDHRIEGFIDKGCTGPGPINAGLYRLCRAALRAERGTAYSLENDVLPGLVDRRVVWGCPVHGSFTDIGIPEDYFRFCEHHGR